MTKNYTLEDVELLRAKANISYEEAVALLDKYNGNVADALVELERKGRIAGSNYKKNNPNEGGVKKFFRSLLRTRVLIRRKDQTIVNLSVLYLAIGLIVAFHLVIASAIAALLLGCRISIIKNSRMYDDESFDNWVDNFKSSVSNVVTQEEEDVYTAPNNSSNNESHAKPQPEPKPNNRTYTASTNNYETKLDETDEDGYNKFTIE